MHISYFFIMVMYRKDINYVHIAVNILYLKEDNSSVNNLFHVSDSGKPPIVYPNRHYNFVALGQQIICGNIRETNVGNWTSNL